MSMAVLLYIVEVCRENKLIEYLEVNKSLPFDNDSVGNALTKLGCQLNALFVIHI